VDTYIAQDNHLEMKWGFQSSRILSTKNTELLRRKNGSLNNNLMQVRWDSNTKMKNTLRQNMTTKELPYSSLPFYS
jgi:hypothetical protein